jgi:hypothetical protein
MLGVRAGWLASSVVDGQGSSGSQTLRRTDDAATLTEASDLLNIELSHRKWADRQHLDWLYHANPYGPAIYGFRRDGDRLDAHYANIPQLYRTPAGPMRMMFSLNAVTRSVAQRKGHFWSIAEELYARDLAEYGAQGVIGVSNDNSTPPVVRKLDFRLLGPLPVRVIPAGPSDSIDSAEVTPEWLGSAQAQSTLADLDHPVEWGWRNMTTPDYLQWRLAAPNIDPFHVHVSDDMVAVSVASAFGPVPAAVVVKLMPRRPVPSGQSISAQRLVGAICRYHGAPIAVYAGFNARVRLRGFAPPRRLQPAPLNLIYRSLTDRAPKMGFRLETFEFLDMDAY